MPEQDHDKQFDDWFNDDDVPASSNKDLLSSDDEKKKDKSPRSSPSSSNYFDKIKKELANTTRKFMELGSKDVTTTDANVAKGMSEMSVSVDSKNSLSNVTSKLKPTQKPVDSNGLTKDQNSVFDDLLDFNDHEVANANVPDENTALFSTPGGNKIDSTTQNMNEAFSRASPTHFDHNESDDEMETDVEPPAPKPVVELPSEDENGEAGEPMDKEQEKEGVSEKVEKDAIETEDTKPSVVDVTKVPHDALIKAMAQAIKSNRLVREKVLAHLNGQPVDDINANPEVVSKFPGISEQEIRYILGRPQKSCIVKNRYKKTLSTGTQTWHVTESDDDLPTSKNSLSKSVADKKSTSKKDGGAGKDDKSDVSGFETSSDEEEILTTNNIGIVCVSKCPSYCAFCGCEIPGNYVRHLMVQHEDEREVEEVKELDEKMQKRSEKGLSPLDLQKEMEQKLVILRNRGNFCHNCKVLAIKKGLLIVVKNPGDLDDVAKFIPCLFCLGFFPISEIIKHMKASCPRKIDKRRINAVSHKQNGSSNRYVTEGKRLLSAAVYPKVSNVCAKVVSEMKEDDLIDVIKDDDIILAYGSHCVEKRDNIKKEGDFIKNKMKQLARLSRQLNKQEQSKLGNAYRRVGLKIFISSDRFDDVVDATKNLLHANQETGSHRGGGGHNGVSLNIGDLLRKLVSIIIGRALRMEDKRTGADIVEKAEKFLNMLDIEWADRISDKLLKHIRNVKTNTIDVLGPTGDIKTLVDTVKDDLKKVVAAAKKAQIPNLLRMLAELSLLRLIIFNMRRAPDIPRMTIENVKDSFYNSGNSWKEDVVDVMTPLETRLADSMLLIKIKDKQGLNVPCLAPADAKDAIKTLLAYRERANILADNPMVFAIPGRMTHISAADVMTRYVQQFCEDHEAVLNPKIRKYVAAACQVFDLQDSGTEYYQEGLGSQVRAHTKFFNNPEDVVQVARVARILILHEAVMLPKAPRKDDDKLEITELKMDGDLVKLDEIRRGDGEGGHSNDHVQSDHEDDSNLKDRNYDSATSEDESTSIYNSAYQDLTNLEELEKSGRAGKDLIRLLKKHATTKFTSDLHGLGKDAARGRPGVIVKDCIHIPDCTDEEKCNNMKMNWRRVVKSHHKKPEIEGAITQTGQIIRGVNNSDSSSSDEDISTVKTLKIKPVEDKTIKTLKIKPIEDKTIKRLKIKPIGEPEVDSSEASDDDVREAEESKKPKPKAKLKNKEEIDAVLAHFKQHIDKKRVPTIDEAEKYLEKRNIELSGWQQVKDIVKQRINLLSERMPLENDFMSMLG